MTGEPLKVALTNEELRVLVAGVNEWLGPAYCTIEMVVAMGYQSYEDLDATAERLTDTLPTLVLSPEDWVRALVATEVAFASSGHGSGPDWSVSTGYSDEFTVRVLRQLQQKLAPLTRRVIGHSFGTRPPRIG